MPRRKSIVAQKKELPAITYSSFEECETEYLEKVQQIYDETDFSEMRCNRALWVDSNVIKPLPYFLQRKAHSIGYTAEDLERTLDLLLTVSRIFNQAIRYQPTVFTFCRLLGISTNTFNNWTYGNDDRGEKSREVQDYFRAGLIQGMITGEINPASGSFIGKATLGMKENDSQQTNINIFNTDRTLEEIMAEYEKNKK